MRNTKKHKWGHPSFKTEAEERVFLLDRLQEVPAASADFWSTKLLKTLIKEGVIKVFRQQRYSHTTCARNMITLAKPITPEVKREPMPFSKRKAAMLEAGLKVSATYGHD